MSDTTFWNEHMVEVKRGEKCERSMQKVYDWSDEDQGYIKGLAHRMYDAGLNFAEIKYELEKIIGVVMFEFEIEKCL